MTQVLLHELERFAGIEQVCGDGVSQAVASGAGRKSSRSGVAREEFLNPSLAERPPAAGEERRIRIGDRRRTQICLNEGSGARKKRANAPDAALGAPNHDARVDEVYVFASKTRRFRDAQAVEVDERKEGTIARHFDGAEEPSDLVLGEISW